VGVCAGLMHHGVEQLVCTPPPAGHGSVSTAHGRLPVPVPAVLEIARRCSIPLASSEGFPTAELTTPTGLALIACWADRFGVAPTFVPQAIGVGLAGPDLETVLQQQAQIDDATPEDLAFLAEELRQAGALEVFSQPIAMKKGRCGALLTVIAAADAGQRLRRVWWRHGTSLGVREQWQQRWALQRRSRRLDTPLGAVRIKESQRPDGSWQTKPEHDDLVALARRHNCPISEVREQVMRAWRP
jgi:uncharacterized protein (DUF111 family)